MDLGNRWHFPEHTEEGNYKGANDAAILAFDRNKWNSLVRESVQNSIDAVDDDSVPVRMEFRFNTLRPSEWPELIQQLARHIRGGVDFFGDKISDTYDRKISYLNRVIQEDSLIYLEISDANTKGMKYESGVIDNPFFGFMLSEGVSVKKDGASGGSFGIGKNAYFNASILNTLILSSMDLDGNLSFMGSAHLVTNRVNGILYRNQGFYRLDERGAVTNKNNIPVIFRRNEYETGTSFYIIGLDIATDMIPEAVTNIKEALIRNYFQAIADKRLDVSIVDDINNNSESILNSNFDEYICGMFGEIEDKAKSINTLRPFPYYKAANGEGQEVQPEESLTVSDISTTVVKDIVEGNKRYHFKAELPYLHDVDLWLMMHPNGNGRVVKMRSPRMVVERSKKFGGEFFGLFLCDNAEGSQFLGSLENPEHNSWSHKNVRDKTNSRFNDGREALNILDRWIQQCVAVLLDTRGQEVARIDKLELSIPMTEDEADNYYSNNTIDSAANKPNGDGIASVLQNPNDNKSTDGHPAVIITTEIKNVGDGSEGPNGIHSSNGGRSKGGSGEGDRGKPNGGNDSPKQRERRKVKTAYHQLPPTKDCDGNILHNLVVVTTEEVNAGKLLLKVSTDNSSEDAIIIDSNNGKVDDNNPSLLTGLKLEKGPNLIKLQLAGSMVYTLKPQMVESHNAQVKSKNKNM